MARVPGEPRSELAGDARCRLTYDPLHYSLEGTSDVAWNSPRFVRAAATIRWEAPLDMNVEASSPGDKARPHGGRPKTGGTAGI